jgi:hypothetical protein
MYTLLSWDMKSQHSIRAIDVDSAVPTFLTDLAIFGAD